MKPMGLQMIMTREIVVSFLIALILIGTLNAILSAKESELSEVHIAPNAIAVPVGRILLIRKEADYCIVRFTKNWGKTGYDQRVEYESYYLGRKSVNTSGKDVQYRKEEVYYKKPLFSIFGHGVTKGAKVNVRCGPIELWWSAGPQRTWLYFNRSDQDQRDYGIELAPTPWETAEEVNLKDPRIKWYRYDEKRTIVIVPLEKLWGK